MCKEHKLVEEEAGGGLFLGGGADHNNAGKDPPLVGTSTGPDLGSGALGREQHAELSQQP